MENISLVKLAILVSERVQNVAGALVVDSSCAQFCVSLHTLLIDISRWLRTLPVDDQDAQQEAAALLEQLRGIFPATEHSLVCHDGPKTRLASFTQLLTNLDAVTLAVRSLASGKRDRQRRTILASLESFLPQILSETDKVNISPSNSDLQAASTEPPDCGREIISLHKTLYTYCSCAEADEVIARVRLRNSVPDDDTGVMFNVFFMAHPHQDGINLESQPPWQDTHISVLRNVLVKKLSNGQGFKLANLTHRNFGIYTDSHREEIRLDSDPPFCSYISAHAKTGFVVHKFSVTGQRLYYEDMLEAKREWLLNSPSISLSRILDELSTSASDLIIEKRKEVLSWLLAKAVWQYYSTPWMRTPWNKDTVHFLPERQQNENSHAAAGIFVNEPFLSFSICPESKMERHCDEKAPKQRPAPITRWMLHKLPKILALGIMLVEIQLGCAIETLYRHPDWAQHCPKGIPNTNTNYKICQGLISKDDFFKDVSVPLEALTRSCIQPKDVFLPPVVRDEEGIRKALYTLVNCLERYLSNRRPHSVKPLIVAGNINQKKSETLQVVSVQQAPPSTSRQARSRPGRTMAERYLPPAACCHR